MESNIKALLLMDDTAIPEADECSGIGTCQTALKEGCPYLIEGLCLIVQHLLLAQNSVCWRESAMCKAPQLLLLLLPLLLEQSPLGSLTLLLLLCQLLHKILDFYNLSFWDHSESFN